MHFRITPELHHLMWEVAELHGLSMSEIVHKAIVGLMAKPPTPALADYRRRAGVTVGNEPHYNVPKVTSAGAVQIQVRGELPNGITSDAVRQKVYDKCMHALTKPRREEFQTSLREGVDYIVRAEEL